MKAVLHQGYLTQRYMSQQGRTGNGTTRSLSLPIAIITTPPISMFCWFKVASAAGQYILMSVDDGATDSFTPGYYIQSSVNNAGTMSASSGDGVSGAHAETVNTFTANVWTPVGAAFDSNSLRRCTLGNGTEVIDTTTINPAGLVKTQIGKGGNASQFTNGTVAWPTWWNIALTTQEFQLLAGGFPPWQMHPQNIISAPFLNELTDPFASNRTWTNNAGMALTTPSTVIKPFYQRHNYRSRTVGGTTLVNWHRLKRKVA